MHAILEKRADLSELGSFLGIVSRALRQYWDRELIVLIDEYDAPLETAGRRGYYDQMLFFIRSLFDCLKDRSEVTGAILTGCLRISKESVFTDTNNFVSHSIKDAEFADSCGFTDPEIQQILISQGLEHCLDEVQKWYDGYVFGRNVRMYCPWSVMSFVGAKLEDSKLQPQPYWINRSSPDIIEHFIEEFGVRFQDKIESLLQGGTATAYYDEAITYRDLTASENNFWMYLYFTGYLTLASGCSPDSTPLCRALLR